MTQASAEYSSPGTVGMLLPALLAALAWALLLGDDPASWVIGLPCVALCAWFARLMPATRLRRLSPPGLLRLLPYFLASSISGGWDVARRVLSPQMAVEPGFITFRLSLPAGPARTFLIQLIGLLPGTLGAWLEGDCLTVHVLHQDATHEDALRAAEERVAAAFALTPDN